MTENGIRFWVFSREHLNKNNLVDNSEECLGSNDVFREKTKNRQLIFKA